MAGGRDFKFYSFQSLFLQQSYLFLFHLAMLEAQKLNTSPSTFDFFFLHEKFPKDLFVLLIIVFLWNFVRMFIMVMELRRYFTQILVSSIYPCIAMTMVLFSLEMDNPAGLVLCTSLYVTN